MQDGGDNESKRVTRQRPWFERHIYFVGILLLFALVASYWYSGGFYKPTYGPSGPILAEGQPDVPLQPQENPQRGSRQAPLPNGNARTLPPSDRPLAARRPDQNQHASEIPSAQSAPEPKRSESGGSVDLPPQTTSRSGRPSPTEVVITTRSEVSGRPRVIDAASLIFGEELICVADLLGEPLVAGQVNRALMGKTLTCRRPSNQGAFVCVIDGNGRNFALEMVSAGLARADVANLIEYESEARSKNIGLWAISPPPSGRRCVAQ